MASVFAVTFGLLFQMAQNIRGEIDALGIANSDSTQWSLAQVDVELLALAVAIKDGIADKGAAIGEVRTRFDVLYSRIRTITTSPIYAGLRQDREAAAALSRLVDYLDESVPLIDGDDAALAAALPAFADRTEAIRPDVRQVTLRGVSVLAREADLQRAAVATTLTTVSLLTAALFFVLIIMLAMLVYYVRRERRRAIEEGLVKARLASIVGTSLDAVVVVDATGRILEFNAAAETIFGYSRAEAVGAKMEDLIVPDHHRTAHLAGMERYHRTGERRVVGKGRIQIEARRKSGEIFPVELSISTAASEGGEIFVSFARDISNRVTSERELIKARDEAVAGERAKADLIAVMSHEMRTPLNGMLGTLDLMDVEGRSAKDLEYLDIIRASGKQLLHHVDNVLEISRVEAGKIVLAQGTMSLRALVRELVDGQRAAAEHRGNTLAHRVKAHGHDYVVGDPNRIRQVLLNLIGNAIKFTRNGTICVEVERLGDSDIVEFRVIDDGIGIDAADKDRVFEEFVTLDASYSRAVGGTGLGLAIVRRLVGAMGGDVGLESKKGAGSLFWFRLPLPSVSKAPPAAAPGTSDAARPAAAKLLDPLKVLIVEDNRINRVVLRDLLEQDGHQVDEAHDGEQGLSMAGRKSYDLVLMDISMPVMDGVAATRAIRRRETPGTRLPIVALTAHAGSADKERFRAAGVDDILVKPISRQSLRLILERFSRRDPAPAPDDGAADQAGLLDRAHLEGLAEALGQAKIGSLLGEFLAEMDAAIEGIATGLETGRIDGDLAAKVHSAAGSSALFGAAGLRRELAELEDRIRGGAPCDESLGQVLRDTWSRTARDLRRHPASTGEVGAA
ncbi:PAS domain-containing hybrid sensor histidine kinase/response regulator [Histidinibacterium lentulum]|uniref:histidine kinase n=1 Tax=Histidinibacterium lentulum TaxID=2480588 RepID=A0A3N2RA92_9RHOB|nr:PAS domain-containing hybrid sensor histidine kinase/response regulator [Histidinibacterium lentulum]ROU04327.1 response regulator [Histidinibacterium lentulum]